MISLLAGLMISNVAVPVQAATKAGPTTTAATVKQIKQTLVNEQVNAVVVVNGDHNQPKVIVNTVAGVNGNRKLTGTSLFPIASLNKSFTGIGIQRLINQGKLKPATKLSRFFPQTSNAANITVDQLLKHTSDLQDIAQDSPKVMKTDRQRFDFIQHNVTATGNYTWLYANSNYGLLAGILSRLTHQSYEQWVQTNIIKRAHLTHTKHYDAVKANEIAWGVNADDGVTTLAKLQKTMTVMYGAGDYFVSATDYWKYVTAFNAGKLVKLSTVTDQINPNGSEFQYIDGFYFSPQGKYCAYGSFSNVFNSAVVSNYHTKQTLVMYTNNIPYLQSKDLANRLAAIYYQEH